MKQGQAAETSKNENQKPLRILVSPLDWGLGHATRCIPLIEALLNVKHQVILGGEGGGLILLRQRFPTLICLHVPGYHIRYINWGGQVLAIFLQIPKIIYAIFHEHYLLKKMHYAFQFDLVISDNRYGFFHSTIPSVFMTHQITPLPFKVSSNSKGGRLKNLFLKVIFRFHSMLLIPFKQVWIPDSADALLSGKLSQQAQNWTKARFIGHHSRLKKEAKNRTIGETNPEIDILAILSGPEPHRNNLEIIILKLFKKLTGTRILVCGKPGQEQAFEIHSGSLNIFSHLNSESMQQVIQNSKLILCRPGYTSLMDFAALDWPSLLLIPTPGQTEQEYLSERMESKGFAKAISQKQFSSISTLEQWTELCANISRKKIDPIQLSEQNDSDLDALSSKLELLLKELVH